MKSNGACEIKKGGRHAKRIKSEIHHTPFHTRDSEGMSEVCAVQEIYAFIQVEPSLNRAGDGALCQP